MFLSVSNSIITGYPVCVTVSLHISVTMTLWEVKTALPFAFGMILNSYLCRGTDQKTQAGLKIWTMSDVQTFSSACTIWWFYKRGQKLKIKVLFHFFLWNWVQICAPHKPVWFLSTHTYWPCRCHDVSVSVALIVIQTAYIYTYIYYYQLAVMVIFSDFHCFRHWFSQSGWEIERVTFKKTTCSYWYDRLPWCFFGSVSL